MYFFVSTGGGGAGGRERERCGWKYNEGLNSIYRNSNILVKSSSTLVIILPSQLFSGGGSQIAATSLHRDLFSYLPDKPPMPQRLEANAILSGDIPVPANMSKMELLDASMKQSLQISTTLVATSFREGEFELFRWV
jgi:hypothetical protein